MKCLNCRGRLGVKNTYSNSNSRTSRAVCERCGAVHTLVTKMQRVLKRGDGAKATARRLAAEDQVDVLESTAEVENSTE